MFRQWGAVPGSLVLTNARLVFESGGPTPYTGFAETVDRVWNIHTGSSTVGSWLDRRTAEYLTLEGAFGRVVFEVAGARVWADALFKAMSSLASMAPPPPPPPPPPAQSGYAGQGPVVVNVQAPSAPVVMMQCRHCGNIFDVTKGRCDKCGAPYK